jgi:predicted phage gp36 major capsid-like protein
VRSNPLLDGPRARASASAAVRVKRIREHAAETKKARQRERWRAKKNAAATYSPTRLPVQYHRLWWA